MIRFLCQMARRVLLGLVPLLLWACGGDSEESAKDSVVRRTIGDTTEVIWPRPDGPTRPVAEQLSIGIVDGGDLNYVFGRVGSLTVGPDGSIYVLDSQQHEVRRFSPDGNWIQSYGREGEGPGELSSPSAIGLLSDGSLLVRDSRNARVQVFRPEPEEWPVVEPGFFTTVPLWVDEADRSYVVTRDPEGEFGAPNSTIVRVVDSSGEITSVVSPPEYDYDPPMATAEVNDGIRRGVSRSPVPFTPQVSWAVHPSGAWVSGVATHYVIELHGMNREGVLRFGRRISRVQVDPEERKFFMDRVASGMRRSDPDWDWGGLEVPRVKPPFRGIYAALDGRVWVLLSGTGYVRDNPRFVPGDADIPPHLWGEAVVFDVFSSQGEYLMTVQAPEDLSLAPSPVFKGDSIWGVSRDELGVQFVKKWVVRDASR